MVCANFKGGEIGFVLINLYDATHATCFITVFLLLGKKYAVGIGSPNGGELIESSSNSATFYKQLCLRYHDILALTMTARNIDIISANTSFALNCLLILKVIFLF